MILHIHVVIDSCQNRVSADQYHMTLWRLTVLPQVTCFSFFTRTAHEISCVLIWNSGRTSDAKSQVRKAVTIELNYLKYLSSRCFENQPNEICSHLSEKASEITSLFAPDKLQNHTNERTNGEERRKRKSEEEERRTRGKKWWLHSVSFIMATWSLRQEKKLLDRKRSIWR